MPPACRERCAMSRYGRAGERSAKPYPPLCSPDVLDAVHTTRRRCYISRPTPSLQFICHLRDTAISWHTTPGIHSPRCPPIPSSATSLSEITPIDRFTPPFRRHTLAPRSSRSVFFARAFVGDAITCRPLIRFARLVSPPHLPPQLR